MKISNKILGGLISCLMITTIFTGITVARDSVDASKAFHDYYSLTTELQNIASTYPNITNLYELGQSVQGRSIWGLKITDNPDIEENEPEIQFEGCHHGNEYMSVEMPLKLAWLLVENYSIDPTVTDLVNNREIWIVPLVNPDGRQLSQRYNANGVDLNRDYGYMHGGSTPAPFSQPETQVMRAHQLENNMVLAYSYHTAAEYVNYVWDYKPQDSPDEPWIDMISQVYADYSGYVKTQGFDWYQTTGASDDGNYGCFGNINTIIETLNSDISAEWDRNRDAMLYEIEAAGMGLSGIVTDAVTGDPIRASVWVEEHYWPVFTDPTVGDYHKGLLEGTYHVHFRANGYEEQVKQITITDANASNILNAALIPGDDYYGYMVTMCEYFDYTNNPSEGIWALGPPDNISASLGNGGMMVIDMGNNTPIVDGTDEDFTIYEGDDTPEGYTVAISNNWNGPWTGLGSGTGTQSFDIGSAGFSTARFVRINDDGIGSATKDYPGFDLDAIQADDPFVADHDILVSSLSIDEVVVHGEQQTVSAIIKNDGLNTETNIVVDFKIDDSVIDTTTISSLASMQTEQVNFIWNPAIGTYDVAIESQPIPDEYTLENNKINKTVDVIAAPEIEVTPTSLTFMVPTNAQDTDTISISNLPIAEAALEYSISYDGDLGGSWLSASPETGTVAIDDSQIVTITVDTTGLSEGDYSGELIITSNDLNEPETHITVDLNVVYGNDMTVLEINSPVGTISYGTYTVNATIQNKGFYDQTNVLVNCSIYEGYLNYEQDFETSDGDFVSTGGLWEYGTPSAGPSGAQSGDYCWGTDLDANYGNDEDATLDSPAISIPSGVSYTLTFWNWYDTESGYDGGNVKISTDNGASWQLLGSYQNPYPEDAASSNNVGIPGEPCFSSSSSGWIETSFDLTDYAGETIMLRWHFGSDGSVSDPGWFIDDVSITGDYGAKADNPLIYYATEIVSIDAYQSQYVEFSPDWVAGGGNYTIQIITLLTGDENPTNDQFVDVLSVQGPSLSFAPADFNFGTMLVNTTDTTTFDIWNDNVGTLTYSLSESCSWLQVSPLSGDSTGEHDTITVDIDTTGLTTGQYHCDISLSSDGGNGIFGVDVFVVDSNTSILDVVQESNDRGFPIRHAADGDWAGAQDFLPTLGTISKVDLYLRKFGTPEFDLVVELREGGIDGTLLDTVVFTPAEVTSIWDYLEVDFADTPVIPGVQYFIVCPPAPSGVTTSFGYEWGYAFGNQYDDGAFWFTRDSGNLWRDLPSMYEFTFRTYGLN